MQISLYYIDPWVDRTYPSGTAQAGFFPDPAYAPAGKGYGAYAFSINPTAAPPLTS